MHVQIEIKRYFIIKHLFTNILVNDNKIRLIKICTRDYTKTKFEFQNENNYFWKQFNDNIPFRRLLKFKLLTQC